MSMAELQGPEIFRAVLESLQTGVYLVDRDRRIVFWNDGAERITGYLRQDVLGRCCRDNIVLHCDENNSVLCTTACPLAETMRDGQFREADVFLLHRAGYRLPVHVRAVPIRNRHGSIIGAAESFDEQRFVEPDRRQAPHAPVALDELTGVPDSDFMQAQIMEHLKQFAGNPVPWAILLFCPDHLDQVKATRGAEAANAVLRVVARTLRNSLRPTDAVGCWTSDRFLAIVADCSHAFLPKVGERLRKIVSYAGIPWWGDQLSVTISVGGTAVQAGDKGESILQRAEDSLRQSVDRGGNCVTVSGDKAASAGV